jgi:hypothetical protein
LQELTVIFFASWKFAAIFPVAIVAMKMSFAKTLLCTNIGGILGVLTFTFFSKFLLYIWNKYYPENWKLLKKKRKLFNKRNRRIVNIKVKYGLTGIVLLNPILLSIPISSFLVTKYYGRKTSNLVYLVAGQILWSFVYCFLYFQLSAGFH